MPFKKATSRYNIHIYSRPRFYLFLMVLSLILTYAVFSSLNPSYAKDCESFISVYVEEGDTLWAIAKRTLPEKTDIRNYIQEIKSVNNLDDPNIKVGDTLSIPVRK